MSFGNWVRKRRLGLRLRANECAVRANISPQYWSEIETERSRRRDEQPPQITKNTCLKIAIGLGIDKEEVLEAAGFKPDETIPHESGEYKRSPSSEGELLREASLQLLYEGLPVSDQHEILQFALIKWQLKNPDMAVPRTSSRSLIPDDLVEDELCHEPTLSVDLNTGGVLGPDGEPVNAEDEFEVLRLTAQLLSMRMRKQPEPMHYEATLEMLREILGVPNPGKDAGILATDIYLPKNQ